MKVGELVRYGNNVDYGVGVIVELYQRPRVSKSIMTATVRWSSGNVSKHTTSYLIRLNTSEDT